MGVSFVKDANYHGEKVPKHQSVKDATGVMDLRIIEIRGEVYCVIEHGDPEIDSDQVHNDHQQRRNIAEGWIHDKVVEQAMGANSSDKCHKCIGKLIPAFKDPETTIAVGNNAGIDYVF